MQVILKDKLESVAARQYRVGRLPKPVDSFTQYVRWALGKLRLDLDVRRDTIMLQVIL